MRTAFGDTSFFVALYYPTDTHHYQALQLASSRMFRVVTTEWVLAEVATFFTRPSLRQIFIQFVEELRRTSKVVSADHHSFVGGLDLFNSRRDKEWSLTDCISINVMRALNIFEALTADHHFGQAGFAVLLV